MIPAWACLFARCSREWESCCHPAKCSWTRSTECRRAHQTWSTCNLEIRRDTPSSWYWRGFHQSILRSTCWWSHIFHRLTERVSSLCRPSCAQRNLPQFPDLSGVPGHSSGFSKQQFFLIQTSPPACFHAWPACNHTTARSYHKSLVISQKTQNSTGTQALPKLTWRLQVSNNIAWSNQTRAQNQSRFKHCTYVFEGISHVHIHFPLGF